MPQRDAATECLDIERPAMPAVPRLLEVRSPHRGSTDEAGEIPTAPKMSNPFIDVVLRVIGGW